ncbi:MAG: hypothetical protein HYX87_06705 [Chloroflexi bacterium]|nr:hypothetical protein [Chloroflexota bacterium]
MVIVRMTKSMAQARLADVPPDKVFYLQGGRVLRNLEDLEAVLREMPEETFRYHSNEAKSDFSHWVGEVIGDEKLARDLQRSMNKDEAARAVAARISWLRSKLS